MTGQYVYNLGIAFDEVVAEYGSRPALSYPSGIRFSYEDVNTRANKVARILLEFGVGRRDVVCIFNTKLFDGFASMLACLKIGAVYANLDLTSPDRRIEKMLSTCDPALILYDADEHNMPESLRKRSEVAGLGFASEEFAGLVGSADGENLEITKRVTSSDPAYIMFTSGSTGAPKGAVMSHGNVLNLIAWGREAFRIVPTDVFTNVNPIYFDNSVFDFYVSLFNGASLCPISSEVTSRPKRLVECINRLECTLWFSVPSLLIYLLTMRALKKDDFPHVRTIVFGGEGFPKSKLVQLYELFGNRIRLVNVYGPTECTCICSSYVISEVDFEEMSALPPLGHIVPNFDYRIDALDQDVRDFGELVLAGPNVGLGYYNDASRTAEAFLPAPERRGIHRITYRTGDLVFRSADEQLHFRGRVDNQIKHMGYRIELGEIETAFSTLGCVDEVGVIYRRDDTGMGQIIAFVGADSEVDGIQLLRDVKEILPAYMVPKRVHVLDALPKSRNGKVDRSRLLELSAES